MNAVCSVLLLLAAVGQMPDSFEPLVYEAEDYTTPKNAWQENRTSEDRWNLWSTDKDADKKWSGGVVLQSPLVKRDRQTAEEGAPCSTRGSPGFPRGVTRSN